MKIPIIKAILHFKRLKNLRAERVNILRGKRKASRGGGVGEYQSFDTRLHDVFLDPMDKVMYLLKKLGKIGIHYSATV